MKRKSRRTQYEQEYYDKLQQLQDKEDELIQHAKRNEKATQKRMRHLARILNIFANSELSPDVLAAMWKGFLGKRPEWSSITNFLFPDSK